MAASPSAWTRRRSRVWSPTGDHRRLWSTQWTVIISWPSGCCMSPPRWDVTEHAGLGDGRAPARTPHRWRRRRPGRDLRQLVGAGLFDRRANHRRLAPPPRMSPRRSSCVCGNGRGPTIRAVARCEPGCAWQAAAAPLDWIRRGQARSRYQTAAGAVTDAQAEVDDGVMLQTEIKAVREAVQSLPEHQRSAVLLAFYHQRTYRRGRAGAPHPRRHGEVAPAASAWPPSPAALPQRGSSTRSAVVRRVSAVRL